MNLPFQDKQMCKEKWMRAGALRQNFFFFCLAFAPWALKSSHGICFMKNNVWVFQDILKNHELNKQ